MTATGIDLGKKMKPGQQNDPRILVDPEDAARAYDRKVIELYGEFALTNEMLGLYPWQKDEAAD